MCVCVCVCKMVILNDLRKMDLIVITDYQFLICIYKVKKYESPKQKHYENYLYNVLL